MATGQRKRKRPVGGGAAGLDYPDIPHVPMDVIPLFVQAVKVTTKFFAKTTTESYTLTTEQEQEESSSFQVSTISASQDHSSNGNEASLLKNLMHRVEEAASAPSNNDEHQKRLDSMKMAAQTWMRSVQRFVRKADRRQPPPPSLESTTTTTATTISNTNTEQQQQDQKQYAISVPYACFLYLWDLQQEHNRVAVRRAALYLSGLLLQKSRDCRFHLEQDAHLSTWISNTVLIGIDNGGSAGGGGVTTNTNNSVIWKNPETAAQQLPLLQHEAFQLLSHLVDQGYATLYPKIGVAAQRIRQQCPNHLLLDATQNSSNNNINNMSDWRRLRDIALEHGEEEIRRVERLVKRSHAYLEILVPRVGQEGTAPSNDNDNSNNLPSSAAEAETTSTEKSQINDGDDDDDDEIDWEDGDGFEDGTNFIPSSNMEHLSAVERTLMAMESAGGLRGGGLEIDFSNPNSAIDPADSNNLKKKNVQDNATSKTKANFQKCATVLTRRHMPRLSMWLEGLINADNLVFRKSSALVSLPSETVHIRSYLVERLSKLKRTVSSILSSATKLCIQTNASEPHQREDSTTAPADAVPVPVPTVAPRLGDNSGRRSLLGDASLPQRRRNGKNQQTRSNRIQIKYRTS